MPGEFSLSELAVDVLLEHGKFGRAPFPFVISYMGTTHTQRRQLRDVVFRDLETRGLMRRGRLEPGVEDALRAFAGAATAIASAAKLDNGEKLFARACSTGDYALLVRRQDNLLVFRETRPAGLVRALVDLLPDTKPAPGQSLTIAKPSVPKPRRANDEQDYNPFADRAQPKHSAGSAQLRAVERIFEKPKLRVGQLTALTVDRRGREVDAGGPVGWFDIEDGRYFMTSRTAADGQTWLTYAPADNARLVHQLTEQLPALSGQGPQWEPVRGGGRRSVWG